MRKRNKAGIVCSIFVLTVFLVAAFYAPGVISRFYDSHTLEQLHTRELDLTTYQVAYGSFEEKLYAIGSALEEGGELLLSEPVEVQLPDIGDLTPQRILEEADKLLLQELQLGYNVSSTFRVVDTKRIEVACRNRLGEELLPESQVYLVTCRCTEISVDKVKDYPKLYYVIPHVSLWVDAEFGKLYGLYLANAPISSLKMEKEVWDVDSREILADYWGLGQKFQLVNGESAVFDSETEKIYETVWGEKMIFMEQDSCLRVYMETVTDKQNFSLRLGMPPFIYDAYTLGYQIEAASVE